MFWAETKTWHGVGKVQLDPAGLHCSVTAVISNSHLCWSLS